MPDPAYLSLGPVQFTFFEVPEELAFPSAQSLAIHDLIGGRRIIQTLGVVWKPISWEGILLNQDAFDRSNTLKRMKTDASVQSLSYQDIALDVIISEYVPTIRHQWKIEYKITVEVVRDRSGTTTVASTQNADSQIAGAQQNATSAYSNLLSGQNTNVTA